MPIRQTRAGSEVAGAGAEQQSMSQKLNWLRAGVLGANDGIVSVAAVVVGVAGATSSHSAIATAGIAAIVGGAISMALGEYVSVSSQSDSEHAMIARERRRLTDNPAEVERDLAGLFEEQGLEPATALRAAGQTTRKDPLATSLRLLHGVDINDVVSPWNAAIASFAAFALGAAIPLLAILLPHAGLRVPVTFAAVLLALGITGTISARIGDAPVARAVLRLVVGGAAALGITWGVGVLFGTQI